ncbi:MAG: hypothetical protein F4118_06595 [Acidimicrobiaceae bacterium]|nr:hypothetical protein [Acidimicrobiaceae bacterium]
MQLVGGCGTIGPDDHDLRIGLVRFCELQLDCNSQSLPWRAFGRRLRIVFVERQRFLRLPDLFLCVERLPGCACGRFLRIVCIRRQRFVRLPDLQLPGERLPWRAGR